MTADSSWTLLYRHGRSFLLIASGICLRQATASKARVCGTRVDCRHEHSRHGMSASMHTVVFFLMLNGGVSVFTVLLLFYYIFYT